MHGAVKSSDSEGKEMAETLNKRVLAETWMLSVAGTWLHCFAAVKSLRSLMRSDGKPVYSEFANGDAEINENKDSKQRRLSAE